MFDRYVLSATKPAVEALARRIASLGITANQISFTGFGFAILAATLIVFDAPLLAVIPLIINRICDGLDGAVARLSTLSDRGGFLDITLDFLFYALIPLAFAWVGPAENALAAATLLAAFIGTGTSFLAFAILAERRGLKSIPYPSKGFYYLGGLTEGTETVACFVLMCLFPGQFAVFAYIFAALCGLTTVSRFVAGWQNFK